MAYLITSYRHCASSTAIILAIFFLPSSNTIQQLVVLILISILIILQKHFNPIIHLRPNVIAKATSNDSQNTKTERAQRRGTKTDHIRLLKRCAPG